MWPIDQYDLSGNHLQPEMYDHGNLVTEMKEGLSSGGESARVPLILCTMKYKWKQNTT
ncbi:MAG: hypothetical protein GY816_02210 [Cytophagales bacterium]|nr:hypothetical protein [Cytophagales bacterium]